MAYLMAFEQWMFPSLLTSGLFLFSSLRLKGAVGLGLLAGFMLGLGLPTGVLVLMGSGR